jgi:hypothetical protein
LQINDRVIEAVDEVFSYAKDVDDWIVIKKELLKCLPSEERKSFSTRDPITKKQRANQFEFHVAGLWEARSGRPVIFKDYEKSEK